MTTSAPLVAGLNVRAEMARKKVTQTQLATVLGISQPSVSARLRGAIAFDVAELALISSELNVPLERLVEGVAA